MTEVSMSEAIRQAQDWVTRADKALAEAEELELEFDEVYQKVQVNEARKRALRSARRLVRHTLRKADREWERSLWHLDSLLRMRAENPYAMTAVDTVDTEVVHVPSLAEVLEKHQGVTPERWTAESHSY